jgi:hypothetical protein
MRGDLEMNKFVLVLALALSGCADVASGYYGRGADLHAKGWLMCDLPRPAKFARSYALVNDAQACRDLGGKLVK